MRVLSALYNKALGLCAAFGALYVTGAHWRMPWPLLAALVAYSVVNGVLEHAARGRYRKASEAEIIADELRKRVRAGFTTPQPPRRRRLRPEWIAVAAFALVLGVPIVQALLS
jgi:hypothetical protein